MEPPILLGKIGWKPKPKPPILGLGLSTQNQPQAGFATNCVVEMGCRMVISRQNKGLYVYAQLKIIYEVNNCYTRIELIGCLKLLATDNLNLDKGSRGIHLFAVLVHMH